MSPREAAVSQKQCPRDRKHLVCPSDGHRCPRGLQWKSVGVNNGFPCSNNGLFTFSVNLSWQTPPPSPNLFLKQHVSKVDRDQSQASGRSGREFLAGCEIHQKAMCCFPSVSEARGSASELFWGITENNSGARGVALASGLASVEPVAMAWHAI